jgi:choline monooxygenase
MSQTLGAGSQLRAHAQAMLPVDPAALLRVLQPIAKASGLPNQAYTGADFFAFERDRIIAKTWFCIGFGKDVPATGDIRPVRLMGVPLLMARRADGSIGIMHNVCSHRGTELVTEPGNAAKLIRCPYHSWVYDLDGRLVSTPNVGGARQRDCPGFDRAQHGLKPVRGAYFWDMVFVNLDGKAEPFETFIAPLAKRWADFDMGRIRHPGGSGSLELAVNCNWKLAVENYCEAYHLPSVHPTLNSYSRLEDHFGIAEDGHFAGQGTHAYTPLLVEGGPGLPQFSGLPERWSKAAEYVALFPNVLLGIHRDHYFAIRLEPLAPDRTLEHLEIYYVGEESTARHYDQVKDANLAAWRRVFAEDVAIVERMQSGRQSPAFQGGVFSPVMDPPTHCFHRWMAERLLAAA